MIVKETPAALMSRIVETQDVIARLEKTVKADKKTLKSMHGDAKILCENGIQSMISPVVKETLQKPLVLEAFMKLGLSEEEAETTLQACCKTTEYDQHKVARLLTEDEKEEAPVLSADPIL